MAAVEQSVDASAAKPVKFAKLRWLLEQVWELVCEHWFILSLCFAIGFAAAVPDFGRNGGWVAAQWSIKYGAVIIIFFLSGCSLKTKALFTVLGRLHVHLFIQSICLVLTPAIGYGIARGLMESSMDRNLVNGLVVAMVMPTTISTNVVFTKQSGGNEAVALVNAVIGNIIGIFVSPAWLYVYLGESGQAPYADVIKQLAVTIIAPLIVGQLAQYFFPNHVKAAQDRINFGKISNVMIILLVWNTFCNTFHRNIQLAAKSWVPMLILEIGLFLFFTVMCLFLATFAPLKRLFNLDKPDAVAVTMCGATKTLALGMPLITVLYGKTSHVGIISLPLIIYHATQCLIGSLMRKPLKRWVDGPTPGAWPASLWPSMDHAQPLPSTPTSPASPDALEAPTDLATAAPDKAPAVTKDSSSSSSRSRTSGRSYGNGGGATPFSAGSQAIAAPATTASPVSGFGADANGDVERGEARVALEKRHGSSSSSALGDPRVTRPPRGSSNGSEGGRPSPQPLPQPSLPGSGGSEGR